MNTKLKKYLKTALNKAVTFVKENKGTILTLGAYMVLIPVMGECNSASNVKITPLAAPLKMFTEFMTGPAPASFTVISGATAAIAWGAGWEQSIMQRALKCVGGGAVATSVGKGMDWIGIGDVSACLM
ncbi:MAG: hypothetical protein IKN12_02735 [Selenomonadaceae bacterium]|nr:hypothetical protein [Selenomonadaceae bacterium]